MQYLEENLQRDWHADYNYVPFNLICNISYFAGHNYEILPRRWNGQNNKSKSYLYKNIASNDNIHPNIMIFSNLRLPARWID